MPYRKFRPLKQFEVQQSWISKHIYEGKLKQIRPRYIKPAVLEAKGIPVYDPNKVLFTARSNSSQTEAAFSKHPSLFIPHPQTAPDYQAKPVYLFDGSQALSEGVSHALFLCNALGTDHLPDPVLNQASIPDWLSNPQQHEYSEHADLLSERLKQSILQAHLYDSALEELPKRHDPILWWYRYGSKFGVPEHRRNDIILSELYRRCADLQDTKAPLAKGTLYRNATVSVVRAGNERVGPVCFRMRPHLMLMLDHALQPIVHHKQIESSASQSLVDISPVSEVADLEKRVHNYSPVPQFPRCSSLDVGSVELPHLHPHTLFTSLNQDENTHQKYPWSASAITGNAIVACYGAALATAQRTYGTGTKGVLNRPVTCQLVQLCRNSVDHVIFQLNTFDTANTNKQSMKNMCWYSSMDRYHEYTAWWRMTQPHTIQPNLHVAHKTLALLNRSHNESD